MSNMSNEDNHEDLNDEDYIYNIDTDIDTIQANMSKSTTRPFPNTRLSNDKWNNLSVEERNVWNTLSPDAKAIILGLSKKPTNQVSRRSMLHDISAKELLSYLHEKEEEESTSNKDEPSNDTTTDTLLINAAASKPSISPADIRQVLSTNHKGNHDNEIDILMDQSTGKLMYIVPTKYLNTSIHIMLHWLTEVQMVE